jgi:hypothetical protein
LRKAEDLEDELAGLSVSTLSRSLLEAISVEKAGFKGMRLLIDRDLVTDTVRDRFAIDMAEGRFAPIRVIESTPYPGRLASRYADVLWMATDDEDEWRALRGRLATRMRWSANDPEEVLQGAATQVVFNECDDLLRKLRFP